MKLRTRARADQRRPELELQPAAGVAPDLDCHLGLGAGFSTARARARSGPIAMRLEDVLAARGIRAAVVHTHGAPSHTAAEAAAALGLPDASRLVTEDRLRVSFVSTR